MMFLVHRQGSCTSNGTHFLRQGMKIVVFGCGIDQLVTCWQWVVVFGAIYFKTCEVYAYSPVAVRFFSKYDVSELVRKVNFFYYSSFHELVNLFLYKLFPIGCDRSFLLFHRFGFRKYI